MNSEYIDHMGSDTSVVRAARVSFAADNLEFDGLESVWDNRFRGGVPFIPLLQPYHGVKVYRKK